MTNSKPRSKLATALRSPYLSIATALVMLVLINTLFTVYNPVERIAFSVFVGSAVVGGITAIVRREEQDGPLYYMIIVIASTLAAMICLYGKEPSDSVFFTVFGTVIAIRAYSSRPRKPNTTV